MFIEVGYHNTEILFYRDKSFAAFSNGERLGSSLEADLRIVRLEGKLRSLCSIRVPSSGLRLCSTFCLNRSNTVSKFLLLKPNKRVRLLSLTVKTSQFNS